MNELAIRVAQKLLSLGSSTQTIKEPGHSLIFPQYHRDKKPSKSIRISEQESRILLANELIERNILFSIETPTESKHAFKGKTPISARFDLTTYTTKGDHAEPECAFELKANNPEIESFRKDLVKFYAFNKTCIWLHTIGNSDPNTEKSLAGKFKSAIELIPAESRSNANTIHLIFAFIQKQKILYSKTELCNLARLFQSNDLSLFEYISPTA